MLNTAHLVLLVVTLHNILSLQRLRKTTIESSPSPHGEENIIMKDTCLWFPTTYRVSPKPTQTAKQSSSSIAIVHAVCVPVYLYVILHVIVAKCH